MPDLLDQIPPDEQIGSGACDTHRCRAAMLECGGTAIVPIRRNGRRWKEESCRSGPQWHLPGDTALGQKSGRDSLAITLEVGMRPECGASKPSAKGSLHEPLLDRPLKFIPALSS